MAWTLIHRCECSNCRTGKEHAHRAYHHQINLLLSRLNEPQRRWFAALEAMHMGHGGKQLMAQVTGLSPTTILRGCNELEADLVDRPDQHLRASGGGSPAAEVKDPPRGYIGNDLDIGDGWRSDGATPEGQAQLATASEFGIKTDWTSSQPANIGEAAAQVRLLTQGQCETCRSAWCHAGTT